ncbi:MAG: ATP-grasp domain-containing protein [Candidatus Hodarchaeota archaeon]
MTNNSIFIFEFISGGGFAHTNIPNSLFCEGFGMLRSIIADFKALDFEIQITLDYRIWFLSKYLQADIIRKVEKNNNFQTIFKELVKNNKYVFIIAPETSGILYELTKIVNNYDKIILSTNLKGIKCGTSKITTYKCFKKKEILAPKTYRIPFKRNFLDLNFIISKFRKLNTPIVIKPEDGVGAESVHYFETENQIKNFFENNDARIGDKKNFIVQEYIKGRNLSLSLVGSSSLYINPLLLSVNFQNIINENNEIEYLGGYTPIENYQKCLIQLSKIIKRMRNLKIEGYYGIDFIEQRNNLFNFIEINPRLTTSYIGLRNVLNINCVELIYNSKIKKIEEFELDLQHYSYYTRIDFNYSFNEELEYCKEELIPKLMRLIPEFITPPISLNECNKYSCFIATKTKDLLASKRRFNEIIQSFESLNFNVLKPKKLIL